MTGLQRVPEVKDSSDLPGPGSAHSSKPPSGSPGSLIYEPPSYFEFLDLALMFSEAKPLEVELGAGDGSFIVAYAAEQPDSNFIAVERLLGRLRKIDRKGRRAGLANLRVLRVEASYLMEYLLPERSTRAVHVYFPDPWPKRKHRKNRLINSRFVELASRVLEPAGRVYLRTDDSDYFAQMLDVFDKSPDFSPCPTPPGLSGLQTDFERDFRARGVHTLIAGYQSRG